MSDPHRPLKNAFGRYATGVSIVACCGRDGLTALTVNSFASVSLDPPLVLWCIEKRASAFADFMAADAYSVTVLRADQQALSERFARSGAVLDPSEYETWITGAPVLRSRLAGFDCSVAARHDAGDHVILVGRVGRFDVQPGAPLLYFASAYAAGPEAP